LWSPLQEAHLRSAFQKEEVSLQQSLLSMDTYEFESRVMSFFTGVGLTAFHKENPPIFGLDGFAKHRNRFTVVWCKRYSAGNSATSWRRILKRTPD